MRFVAIGRFVRNPVPHRHQAYTQIMPEIGQLMYPNTRSRAKHIYTEEEVRGGLIGAERLRAAGLGCAMAV